MKRPTLGEVMEQHRRLAILRMLHAVGKHHLSELVLRSALTDSGHPVSYKRIRRDLEWLAKQKLVRTKELPGDILGVRLRRAGEDVALGLEIVPGVARPSPED